MDMTLLNQYPNETEAYIDKGYLESNGIECQVVANAMSDIFPAPGAGTGSIDLYVPENKYKEAYDLLFHRK
ncbi:MAG: DUF2007 domain-containing protein [Muribaculaceae bacterium]|nr:DUF2007 domain-containing protein [Muribaculaceae bacterium]